MKLPRADEIASRASLRTLADALPRQLTRRFARAPRRPPGAPLPSVEPANLDLILRQRSLRSGQQFVEHFVSLCGLRPDEAVLDVGSGEGGVAIALTKYLDARGSYAGLDIRRHEIERLRLIVTPRYPRFRFDVADVYNVRYNRRGKSKASKYRFPYADESFDFACLTSVFTHMQTPDIDQYLREIARVLKRGGRCLITYFLLNAESSRMISSGQSRKQFGNDRGEFHADDGPIPERAIALEEDVVRSLYAKHGLTVREPIHYGGWCGRRPFLSRQDMVIADKA